jgi:hypothetical protein
LSNYKTFGGFKHLILTSLSLLDERLFLNEEAATDSNCK